MITLNERNDFTLDAYRRVAWEGESVMISEPVGTGRR